ncbi:putative N-formylglutamate amidohydrolase [Thalassovita autumnalis]|uniref:N-formylglutamate amidohydrolase n=1 Tax=Thalassovita autumnalis TaxID=2072972 RepID=A0A0P1FYP8_9RHOB|nr:N-formylglutamate amidohydrolase [Thalassovita autumnalis]CUH64408.1 putative N-formylglutamate amidohydrolase [Thalassovita autumnalis]CUH74366.1 putative N-formylglutamate amidohydrolase [Thalassovita autumnalis]
MTYHPFHIHGDDRDSRFLITCDHATNTVPPFVNGGELGLGAGDMNRHIAYDVGAAGVTRALADALGCAAILSDFSRLVIDPNRGDDDPTLLMKLYDGTIIPANRHADAAELERRLDACYRPYHAALADLAARRDDTVIISMHSFTPQLQGRAPRPWHIGVLWAEDGRYAQPLITRLKEEPDLCVGDNEPYTGYLPGDAIDTHATAHGRPNALIEIRNDLIETDQQQAQWGQRLAPILTETLSRSGV